ncbi:MAG: hypothetical protein PHY43_11635 [Verrucomicrobiales bacterium]|nr:hypothetical protein [Verrucomicrobiales bacterium]
MSTTFFSATRLVCAALCLFLLAGATAHAGEGTLKLEAQLVVGSNDPQTKGTPVSPKVEKKLKRLPLKWGSYFVVSSQQFSLAKDEGRRLVMGGSEMVVKNLGGERVELTLINRGKITQSLSKGHTLVTNVKDENSFVVLRQMD